MHWVTESALPVIFCITSRVGRRNEWMTLLLPDTLFPYKDIKMVEVALPRHLTHTHPLWK